MIKNENNIPVGYKDSAVGIIPQEWEVKNIEEICDIYVGRDVQKNHFKRNGKRFSRLFSQYGADKCPSAFVKTPDRLQNPPEA